MSDRGTAPTELPDFYTAMSADSHTCACSFRGAVCAQYRTDGALSIEARTTESEYGPDVWIRISRACGLVYWFPLSAYFGDFAGVEWADLIACIKRRAYKQCESYDAFVMDSYAEDTK